MFYLVGLPDSAVKESHQRIISALQVNGYRMPTSNIVINMAPADIRKEGTAYDLPLAIGILAASEVIQSDKLERYLLMGELSLDGSLQPIKGALPIAIKARELGFEGMIVPQQNTAPIKQLAIQALPANLFLSPSGKIEGKNMSEEDIKKKLEEIEQKEKEKKESEKKLKKQNRR